MVSLSKLYHLKNQAKQVILLYDAQIALQQLALATLRVKTKEMQYWLRVTMKKYLDRVTPRPRQIILRRIKDIFDFKNLATALDLEKGQLKVEISFANMHFNSLIQLKIPKLWEEVDVQSSVDHQVDNNKSFFEKDVVINLSKKKFSDLQEMNKQAQEAIARF